MVGLPKGRTNNPNGRPKGSKDKATSRAREAIANFVDNRANQIDGWLEEIYKEHGAKDALEAFYKFVEFHVPKQARTEIGNFEDEELKVINTLHLPRDEAYKVLIGK